MADLTHYHYAAAVLPSLRLCLKLAQYQYCSCYFYWNEKEKGLCVKKSWRVTQAVKIATLIHLFYVVGSAANIFKSNIAFVGKLQALDILVCILATLILRYDMDADLLPFEMVVGVLRRKPGKDGKKVVGRPDPRTERLISNFSRGNRTSQKRYIRPRFHGLFLPCCRFDIARCDASRDPQTLRTPSPHWASPSAEGAVHGSIRR